MKINGLVGGTGGIRTLGSRFSGVSQRIPLNGAMRYSTQECAYLGLDLGLNMTNERNETNTSASEVVAYQMHEEDSTRIHATLYAPVLKEFCLEASREDEGRNWYIEMTDESGYHTYDGYWRDSERRTCAEVLAEAAGGSLLHELAPLPADAILLAATQPNAAPAAEVVEDERKRLRVQQSDAVMPQIGPLLDAWEGIDNDTKGVIREQAPELAKRLSAINRAMDT